MSNEIKPMLKTHATVSRAGHRGFTLIELLTVMAIIAILAGLVLSVSGWAQNKAARSRAEGEIKAMENACESYKTDNAVYPRGKATGRTVDTDTLDARVSGDPTATGYKDASYYLYGQLSGDWNGDGIVNIADGAGTMPKIYMTFKPDSLAWTSQASRTAPVLYIMDPFGNSYGYSTACTKWEEAGRTGNQLGYNPTFDLWSTAGKVSKSTAQVASDQPVWVKNW
jgi:prepilin-type N-terminal cleavage/methylation domain-containing protein